MDSHIPGSTEVITVT